MRRAIIGRALVLIATLLGMTVVGTPRPARATLEQPCKSWNLAKDFLPGAEHANPNPDECGNRVVWSFGEYSQAGRWKKVGHFIRNAFNTWGLDQWQGKYGGDTDGFPAIGINATGKEQKTRGLVWPAGVIRVHPWQTEDAAVLWQDPAFWADQLSIRGSVTDLDGSCGNGVTWSVRNPNRDDTVASGHVPNGFGNTQHFAVRKRMTAVLFTVGANHGDYYCDSTEPQIQIERLP